MPLACIFHKTLPMRVVSFAEREQLVATGEWYRHPKLDKEETNHEEQIRRVPRKRRSNGEHSST